jgi:16S rRNA (cytosine967-C5)-methyltransferase
MTKGAHLKTLADILDQVLSVDKPATHFLKFFFKNNRYIGSSDRRILKEKFYRILRHRYRYEATLTQENFIASSAEMVFLDHLIYDQASDESLFDVFSDSPYDLPLPSSSMQNKWQKIYNNIHQLNILGNVTLECPTWLQPYFKQAFQENIDGELQDLLKEAPCDIRVNTLKTNRDDLLKLLKAEKVSAEKTPLSPWGLRIHSRQLLEHLEIFKEGYFEIQDEGSQLLALISESKPSQTVLDYCAGAGGKTLALAAMMHNKGRIIAMDIDERRLEKGTKRLRRAGVFNTVSKPLNQESERYLRKHTHFFDCVFLDVPCSGTGTWRRNPEARWNLTENRLQELMDIQKDILNKTAPLVKKGGILLYSTCSVLPAENQNQIESFLENHKDFILKPISEILPQFQGDYLQLSPYKTNTDGFFAVVLQRIE